MWLEERHHGVFDCAAAASQRSCARRNDSCPVSVTLPCDHNENAGSNMLIAVDCVEMGRTVTSLHSNVHGSCSYTRDDVGYEINSASASRTQP